MPTNTEADVRLYELCFLYPSNLSSDEEKTLLKEVDDIFDEANAKVVEKDEWGKRGIAYPIKGNNTGNYIVFYLEIDPANLKEMDQNLKLLKNSLRHLIVKPPKGYAIESYASKFTEWQKSEQEAAQNRVKSKEDRIKKQVADKAKRQAKKVKDTPKEEVDEEAVSEEIDKLIADDELEL